jgi:hypothetical protein
MPFTLPATMNCPGCFPMQYPAMGLPNNFENLRPTCEAIFKKLFSLALFYIISISEYAL